MVEVKRDFALDWVKGFLIVCVALGHTARVGSCADILDRIVLRGIYGFHMPLFMLLSGYFYRIGEPREMILKTFRRIVLPYAAASFLFNFAHILHGLPFAEALRNVMLGRANGALWFLYALAVIQVTLAIGLLCYRLLWGGCSIAICSTLFTVAVLSPVRCEPWMLFYFGAGMLLARCRSLFPSGLAGVIGFSAIMWYGHPWYTELCWQTIGLSLFALMALHSIAEKVAKIKMMDVFTGLGRHTMAILVFHPLFNTVYRLLMKHLLSVDGSGILFFLSSTTFAVCGCLVLEMALKKCRAGWLFGLR